MGHICHIGGDILNRARRVALHGPQKRFEENCKSVALEPKSAPFHRWRNQSLI
jgi:hypothetical protein